MRFAFKGICLALLLAPMAALAQGTMYGTSGMARGQAGIARLQALTTKLKADLVAKDVELEGRIDGHEGRLDGIDATLSDHGGRLDAAEDELADIEPHAKAPIILCEGDGRILQWTGTGWTCVDETDPTVGPHATNGAVPPYCHLINAKLAWTDAAGGSWQCVPDQTEGVGSGAITTEDDPEVGTLIGNRLCRSDGNQVQCDNGAPTITGGDVTVNGRLTADALVSTGTITASGTITAADPVADNNVATKAYVDAAIAALGGGGSPSPCVGMTYRPLAGEPCVPAPDGCTSSGECKTSFETGLSVGVFVTNYRDAINSPWEDDFTPEIYDSCPDISDYERGTAIRCAKEGDGCAMSQCTSGFMECQRAPGQPNRNGGCTTTGGESGYCVCAP